MWFLQEQKRSNQVCEEWCLILGKTELIGISTPDYNIEPDLGLFFPTYCCPLLAVN